MDVGRRAKQFAPFAALRGLDETIRQQEIIYEPKRDLSEEKKNELDMKLRILAYGMKIQATYFQKSWKFDKTLKLYSLMTTKPEEVEKREKEMEAEKHEGNR